MSDLLRLSCFIFDRTYDQQARLVYGLTDCIEDESDVLLAQVYAWVLGSGCELTYEQQCQINKFMLKIQDWYSKCTKKEDCLVDKVCNIQALITPQPVKACSQITIQILETF